MENRLKEENGTTSVKLEEEVETLKIDELKRQKQVFHEALGSSSKEAQATDDYNMGEPPNLKLDELDFMNKYIELNKSRPDRILMLQDFEDDKEIEKVSWVLDSGAMVHTTGDINLINHTEKCDFRATSADGSSIFYNTKGKATITNSFTLPGGLENVSRSLKLSNVYFKNKYDNLISTGKLIEENDCSIELLKDAFLIKKDIGKAEVNIEDFQNVAAVGRVHKGEYIFESEPPRKQKRSSFAGDFKNNMWLNQLNTPLKNADQEIADILSFQKARQWQGLELFPSANITSVSVREVLESAMTHKYTEEYPGVIYEGEGKSQDYVGMNFDIGAQRQVNFFFKRLCQSRALSLFGLDSDEWGVNVQSLSGSTAIFQIYTALLAPLGKIMEPSFPSNEKYSAVAKFYNTHPYELDSAGKVDYTQLEQQAGLFKPDIIVAGATGYPRSFDYERMRKLCDKEKAILLADISDITGLVVVAGIDSSPFKHAHVVTTSTQRSLCGPRGALIFYRKGMKFTKNGVEQRFGDSINKAVFPGFQGGPHNQTIVALAVALKQANRSEYKICQKQIVKNAKKLAAALKMKGYEIFTGGTDNHLVVVNLSQIGIEAERVLETMELACISADKNISPEGIKLGSHVLTSRGFLEEDFLKVAGFIHDAVSLALEKTNANYEGRIQELRQKVVEYAEKFPIVGIRKKNVDQQK
ncbi:hypothetical protein MKW92_002415 [Papaver armeniacum]|nr:hypothetical protein MKW92_002415 [Papaver armeniacum]